MLLENGIGFKKENRLCSFCSVNAIQDEFRFLIDCPNYKKLRKSALKFIQDTENFNLSRGIITKKIKAPFSNRSLQSLFVLGKFVKTAMESRESPRNEILSTSLQKKKNHNSLQFLLT